MIKYLLAIILIFSTHPIQADLLDWGSEAAARLNQSHKTLKPFDIENAIRVTLDDLHGWSKVDLYGEKGLWMPTSFLKNSFMTVDDPKVWLTKIKKMKFCQPSKIWKKMPVFYNVSNAMTSSFHDVLLNNRASNVMYSFTKTVGYNGRYRTVSYNMSKEFDEDKSPIIKVNCRAKTEDGNSHHINQIFNLNEPDKFRVLQKKIFKDGSSILI